MENTIRLVNACTDYEDIISCLVGTPWSLCLTTSLQRITNDVVYLKNLSKYVRNKLISDNIILPGLRKNQIYTKFHIFENIKFGKGNRLHAIKVLIILNVDRQKLLFSGLFLSITSKDYTNAFPNTILIYNGQTKLKPMIVNMLKDIFDTSISPFHFIPINLYLTLAILFRTNYVTQNSFSFLYQSSQHSINFTIDPKILKKIRTRVYKMKDQCDIETATNFVRHEIEQKIQETFDKDISSWSLQQIKSTCFMSKSPNIFKSNSSEFFLNFLLCLKEIY